MTVALTDDQVTRSQQGQSLWLQGGAVDDPVLDKLYPGQYGFAALRCAVDNLNGDNVEYIAYPNGATHVLCYAYYVEPPPTSGTIVVNKVVDDPAVTTRQDFSFIGNHLVQREQPLHVVGRERAAGLRDLLPRGRRGAVGVQRRRSRPAGR